VLSPDDLQIIERDRDVPGLGVVLDTEALLNALQAGLPDAGVQLLETDYVHYKPHTNCLVAGRLRTVSGELPFYAKAYGADSPVKLEKTRALRDFPSPLGPGTLILEDAGIGVYFFPIDHQLKGLRRLGDSGTVHSLLRGLLGKSHDFSDATLRPLRYKPERRYVACMESPAGQKLLLKFFVPNRYQAAKRAAQAFGSHGPTEAKRATYFFDRYSAMGLEWLPGRLLSDVIMAAETPELEKAAAIEKTGAALGELHSHTPGTLKKLLRADEFERLNAQAATIGHLYPETGAQAEGLVATMISSLEEISGTTTALHGDFYDRQVLLSDDTPVILDLDEARLGHPAVDLGLFIAHLERHRLYGRLSAEEVDTFADAMIRGYQSARHAPPQSVIRLYTGIGLLHLAAEPFRYREPNWRRQIENMLAGVEGILGGIPPARSLRQAAV
jgi:aminoglycoside phosphotransferase (APT) family kinase protein